MSEILIDETPGSFLALKAKTNFDEKMFGTKISLYTYAKKSPDKINKEKISRILRFSNVAISKSA